MALDFVQTWRDAKLNYYTRTRSGVMVSCYETGPLQFIVTVLWTEAILQDFATGIGKYQALFTKRIIRMRTRVEYIDY